MRDPSSSPQSAPAMVPLQVVLAGGTGMSFDDACEKIFQEFDPPIITGTYSGVSRARQKTNAELGDASPYQNNQSEHMLANSAFQGERGVNASNIAGASKYTEGSAFSYSVYDDQSAGTEHKFLTGAAREFDQTVQGSPTVKDRLASAKEWTTKSLLEDLERDTSGNKRSRIKDANKRTPKEREQLAEAAAECLAQKAAAQMAKKGIKPETPTRKGLGDGEAPAASPSPQAPPRSRSQI
jgi:hypothetical protein